MRGVGSVGRGAAGTGKAGAARGSGVGASVGGGFAVPAAGRGGAAPGAGGGATAAAADAGAAAGAAPVAAGLLALQAMAPPGPSAAERDAAASHRAEALLEALGRLQRGLLGGALDREALERLAALGTGEDGADPALRAVVRAIALRAAVELARRGG